jgi:hypothetical protein
MPCAGAAGAAAGGRSRSLLATVAGALVALRALRWRTLLRHLLRALLVLGLLRLLLHAPAQRALLGESVAAVALALVTLKYGLELPLGWRRALALRRAGGRVHRVVLATQPPEWAALLRLVAALLRDLGRWGRRRSPPALPDGQRFGFLRRGSYRALPLLMVVSLVAELPLLSVLLDALKAGPGVHRTVLGLSVFALALMFGDRWAVRASSHVLDARSLHLHVGERCRASIARSAIVGCEPAARGGRVHARRGELVVSPFDAPNLTLTLDAAADTRIEHLKLPHTGVHRLHLYLDDPQALAAALASPMPSHHAA